MPSHPTSLRPILILPSHLCLGLTSHLFISGFPTQTLYTFLCPTRHIPCSSHIPWFAHPNNICNVYKSWCSSSCSFLQPPATSSPLDPSVFFFSAILSNTHHHQPIFFPLPLREQFSNPYTATAKLQLFFHYQPQELLKSTWSDGNFIITKNECLVDRLRLLPAMCSTMDMCQSHFTPRHMKKKSHVIQTMRITPLADI
jgi:hypothetical protein